MNAIELTPTAIIQNSILSSVYIDDKIVEPFTEKNATNEQYYNVSQGLFNSFRGAKKTIDFYRYNKNWNDDVDYIFKNRDLLILDWQLDDTQALKQPETLKILKKAVQTDNLHFVSIYTESKNLDEILYSIKAYFDNSFNKESQNACEVMLEALEAELGIDTLKLFRAHDKFFFQLALTTGELKQTKLNELKSKIQNELGNNYRIFMQGLKKVNIDLTKACDVLGYYVHEEPLFDDLDYPTEVKTDYIADNFIVVNHTIIQVTSKNNPEPKDLFDFFTNAIQKVAGNLLTLISLEVRGLLRESSGFVGKDADLIKDEILFHQLDKKEAFIEFLMSIIKSHTISYFDHKQGKLKSVTAAFWNIYKKDKNLEASIDSFSKDEVQILAEIKKLNVYYNILHIQKYSGSALRFGDIFFTVDQNGKRDGRFFLCVTAHCDCLNPKENIKNNFFFVGGNTGDINKLIKEGDGVFCSYIKNDTGVSAVNWNPKPVIINIPDSKIYDNKLVGKDGLQNQYTLVYHSTLKENYTQRMANNSFAHAMRVGIDFASL
ncbi:response regulator receiver domain [Danxiaibacter flavus]|uniref:Response regulator receiver domain n=1 Tax=Danxiaibacter flavus TaxID=3049108 RepID=A0ABV3ZMF0_9BACT|nr:response regulator receiver domain [Chitinophagaceae bacterium DXS]